MRKIQRKWNAVQIDQCPLHFIQFIKARATSSPYQGVPQYFPFLYNTLKSRCRITNVQHTSLAERLLMLKAPRHFTLHHVILMQLCEHLRRESNVSQYLRNSTAAAGSVYVTSLVLWLLCTEWSYSLTHFRVMSIELTTDSFISRQQ
jgi:hypothetical protein